MPRLVVDAAKQPPLGMPASAFLRDYWQKHPLLIRRAFEGLRAPLSPEDLAGLACEDLALARLVLRDRRRERWTLRQGPFAESDFAALPACDWTLLVQDVDKWDVDVRALLRHFAFLPRWRIDDVMVSYAAPGGSVGPHTDHYDVFLLQGMGHRRWQIDNRRVASTALCTDSELKLLRAFDPDREWVLGPGDMLYLPPGVPHHGEAIDACLTFSVGMRAPSLAELVGELADHLQDALPESRRYADPDLQPPTEPAEIDAAALARARTALNEAIDLTDDELGIWLGRYLTRYRSAFDVPAPRRAPSAATLEARLAAGAILHPHPFVRFAWRRESGSARLFAQGQSWRCRVGVARRLCAPAALDLAGYRALDADAADLVGTLVRAGLLVLSRR